MDMLSIERTIQNLHLRITQLENMISKPQEPEDIFSLTTKILQQMQIPANQKGYYYIREAVVLIYENPNLLSAVTKELYPTIAREFKTTPSRVERGIRFACETAWNKPGVMNMEEIFGESSHYDKPTNSEVIASIVDYLKLQRRG